MKKLKSGINFPFVTLLAFLFFMARCGAIAKTFYVSNAVQLQSALDEAAFNEENDVVVVTGTYYYINDAVTYWSDQNYSLQIVSTDNTVLNAGSDFRVLELVSVGGVSGDLTVEGLTVEYGTADYGGGIYMETTVADIHLINVTAQHNTGTVICGGVNCYSNAGNIEVINSVFLDNTAPNMSGYPNGTAGGLFVQTELEGTVITLSGCRFSNNYAQRDGGGAMLYPLGSGSTVIAEGNTFEENSSGEFGGGCWIRCPGGDAVIRFENNSVTNNISSHAGSGGGTYIETETGDVSVSDNLFVDNEAVWQGGGLWISHNGGNLSVTGNRFSGNLAQQNGGGANVFLEYGNASVESNVFNENTSHETGGGFSWATTSANSGIFNNTFYDNSADEGGDIYFYFDNASATCNFYNNILFESSSPPLAFSGQVAVQARYCDIANGTGQPWFGTGCIDADPLFADAGNGNFQITWRNFPVPDNTMSPCIDAGDPESPFDSDNTVADMGAFFFNQDTTIFINNSLAGKINLTTYPNPCFDILFVNVDMKKVYSGMEVILQNLNGVEIFSKPLSPPDKHVSFPIDVAPLPRSVYLVKILVNGQAIFVKKIIKR